MATKELSTALESYFKTLSRVGYSNYHDVTSLLVASCIEEILTGPMAVLVTTDDYRTLLKSLECIKGSCLLPFNTYQETIVNLG